MTPLILDREELTVVSAITLARLQEPLADHIADIVAFAEGRIQRSDLEAGLQALILAIYEDQEDCPTCGGLGTFLKDDQRRTWKCHTCNGKGWRWKPINPTQS